MERNKKSNCDENVKTHLNFSVENILKENFQKRRNIFDKEDHSKSSKEAKFISRNIFYILRARPCEKNRSKKLTPF